MYRLETYLRDKVCISIFSIIYLIHLCILVIVTEKTSILLKYMQQHWDKKVNVSSKHVIYTQSRINFQLVLKILKYKMGFLLGV